MRPSAEALIVALALAATAIVSGCSSEPPAHRFQNITKDYDRDMAALNRLARASDPSPVNVTRLCGQAAADARDLAHALTARSWPQDGRGPARAFAKVIDDQVDWLQSCAEEQSPGRALDDFTHAPDATLQEQALRDALGVPVPRA